MLSLRHSVEPAQCLDADKPRLGFRDRLGELSRLQRVRGTRGAKQTACCGVAYLLLQQQLGMEQPCPPLGQTPHAASTQSLVGCSG